MVGIVADPAMVEYLSTNPKTPAVSAQGLLYGGGLAQFWHQLLALVVIVVYDAIMTFVVLKIVSIFVPLRASDGDVIGGDLAIHGVDPMPVPVVIANGTPKISTPM